MSYDRLKKALQKMKETGVDGFEGLVARLLSKILGESFIVARSGDQPSGDALALSGNITMQAKRYREKTKPSEKEIIGDIYIAMQDLEDLDLYVLAITRSSAQLQSKLLKTESETGLDIIILDWENNESGLPILCLFGWEIISSFPGLEGIKNDLGGWASQEKEKLSRTGQFERLQQELIARINSYVYYKNSFHQFLKYRFGVEKSPERTFPYVISLMNSVPRKVVGELKEWWKSDSNICYLEGEEGTGKSWAMAQFGLITSQEANAVVLWLDSTQWHECKTLNKVIWASFENLGINDLRKIERLTKKTIDRWKSPILILLDGINERGALESAKGIISDFRKQNIDHKIDHIRLAFVTRPLENYAGYEKSVFSADTHITAGSFDDQEFTKALEMQNPPIPKESVPNSLLQVAKKPRLFQACIRLRDRFKSFSAVTEELVLWEDLVSKIENTDPQVRTNLGWRSEDDAAEILSKLAGDSKFDPVSQKAIASQDLLNQCFQNSYYKIRQDLVEHQIFSAAHMTTAEISYDHYLLGVAFYLLESIRHLSGKSINDIFNEILKIFEPIHSEDHYSKAIFAALMLSYGSENKLGIDWEIKRAALLFAWVYTNNAWISYDKLDFWAQNDTGAYLEFIEHYVEQYLSKTLNDPPVWPLLNQWKQDGPRCGIIKNYLSRWLRLIWSPDYKPDQRSSVIDGHKIPLARSERHLKLSEFALIFLSIRPDLTLLEDLAICVGTAKFSFSKYKDHILPNKSLESEIGILMRWNYTEKCLANLEDLAKKNPLLKSGCVSLASQLWIANVPDILKMGTSKEKTWQWRMFINPLPLIKLGKPLFPKDQNYSIQSQKLDNLAVRLDLPELLKEDRDVIKSRVEEICEKACPHQYPGQTREDYDLRPLWPWYAKYFPTELSLIIGKMEKRALSSYKDPLCLLTEFAGTYPVCSPDQRSDLVNSFMVYISNLTDGTRKTSHWFEELLNHLLILSLDDENIQWMDIISKHSKLRDALKWWPCPTLLYILITDKVYAHAKERALKVPLKSDESLGIKELSELAFWLIIISQKVKEDPEVFQLAKRLIMANVVSKNDHFYLFSALAASGGADWFEIIFSDPQIRPFLNQIAFDAFHFVGRSYPKEMAIEETFDSLMRSFPLNIVAFLFSISNRREDFNLLMTELFKISCDLLISDGQKNIGFGNLLELDEHGNISIKIDSFRLADDGEKWAAENWKSKKIEELPPWFVYKWAEMSPELFASISKNYLEIIQASPRKRYRFAQITSKILSMMLMDSPSEVINICNKLNKSFDVYESWITDNLWDMKSYSSLDHSALRRSLIENAKNDLQLMEIVGHCLDYDAEAELLKLAKEYLDSDIAMERCLGVSLLPWLASPEVIDILENLKNNDPSGWVQDHATWAFEVAQQERSCREVYMRALHEHDILKMSALLQQIKHAITPFTKLWPQKYLDEESSGISSRPQENALLRWFWHDFVTRANTKQAFGRDLEKYCRGDEISSFIQAKFYPWLNLNELSEDFAK